MKLNALGVSMAREFTLPRRKTVDGLGRLKHLVKQVPLQEIRDDQRGLVAIATHTSKNPRTLPKLSVQ